MEIIFRESRKYFPHKTMNFKLTSKLVLGGGKKSDVHSENSSNP